MSKSDFSWFGIDFGTTNSCAVSFTGTSKDNSQWIPYGDNQGGPFPSVVAIDKKNGKVVVGRDAKEKKNELLETHEYFSSIKSLLGKDEEYYIAGKKWTPIEITSEILKALKQKVEGDDVNKMEEAVVAVPIGFTPEKRKRLRTAAELAGIKIKMYMSEPTAAYCSNFMQLRGHKNVAVFDWGGGTLDISVLNMSKGVLSEISTKGMLYAGEDIDIKLAEKMHSKFVHKYNLNLEFEKLSPKVKDRLLTRCESEKRKLGVLDDVSIMVQNYDGSQPVKDVLTYEEFKEIIADDVDRALECLAETIKEAGFSAANIDCILCVGGSSKLRPLKEALIRVYGEDIVYYPDEVMFDIAKGAAFVSTRPGLYETGKSLGLLLSDGNYFQLLREGQPLRTKERTITFGTVEGGEARFVFTDGKYGKDRSFTEHLTVKTRGFVDELISVSYYVDRDFVFRLKAQSNKCPEEVFDVWTYDKLKIRYSMTDALAEDSNNVVLEDDYPKDRR